MMGRYKKFFERTGVRATFKHMSQYVAAVYLAQGIAAVRSFINARWLGPQDYGFWGWLVFIVTFGYHLHLGVQEMMIKEIPAFQANGQGEKVRRSAQLTFSFLSFMLLMAAALMVVVALALPKTTPSIYRWGWIVAGCVMILEVLFYSEQVVARSLGSFGRIGATLLITNIISLALTCWLVIRHGIVGLYGVGILTPLFGLIYLHRYTRYSWRFRWEGRELWDKIRRGWPIVAMSLAFLAINWVDRSIIMHYLGVRAHGYYTLGAMLSFLVFLFPKGLADVLEPKLHFHNSLGVNAHSIRKNFLTPLRVMAWLMPLGLLFGHVILPWVVGLFLPDYVPGIMVMRILIWSSYFLGVISLTKSSLVAFGLQSRTWPIYGIAIFINAVISLWMVHHGYGVSGIALGSVCAFGMISVWLLGLVILELKQSKVTLWRYALEIYGPFAFLSLPCLTQAWLTMSHGFEINGWMLTLEILGLVAYLGLGYYHVSKNVFKFYVPLENNIIQPSKVLP